MIRDTLGQILLSKMADPRFDPARTSITRVEVPDDLLSAKVYISVMGEEPEQRRTLHPNLSHGQAYTRNVNRLWTRFKSGM